MVNKHTLLNNKLITNSANLIREKRPSGRALVVSGNIINGLTDIRLTDFFDIVISESLDAHRKIGFSDIIFYTDGTAYKDSIFAMDEYKSLSDVVIMTNFNATRDLIKLKKDLDIYNLNYIPSSCACISAPGGPLQNELNSTALGVHLALVLGCTDIYADRQIDGTKYLDTDKFKIFVTEKAPKIPRPLNMLKTGRVPFLKAAF